MLPWDIVLSMMNNVIVNDIDKMFLFQKKQNKRFMFRGAKTLDRAWGIGHEGKKRKESNVRSKEKERYEKKGLAAGQGKCKRRWGYNSSFVSPQFPPESLLGMA
jgi:protein required for attachment to host cells